VSRTEWLSVASDHADASYFDLLLAGIIRLHAIHRPSGVEERGAIEPREMVDPLLAETCRMTCNISIVAGLRVAMDMPVALLRDAHLRTQLGRAQAAKASLS
jgi:hypothetical protein